MSRASEIVEKLIERNDNANRQIGRLQELYRQADVVLAEAQKRASVAEKALATKQADTERVVTNWEKTQKVVAAACAFREFAVQYEHVTTSAPQVDALLVAVASYVK